MDKEQRNLREEILLDTLKYYSEDTSRRCEDRVECRYHPSTLGMTKKQSQGCAVGRLLSDYQAKKLDSCGGMSADDIDQYISLPKKFKIVGLSFLQDLQGLHDNNWYWNDEKGLSDKGVVKLKNIIKFNRLRKTPFREYL